MDKKQIAAFLKQIIGAYPAFEPTPERIEIWSRNMANVDYELAKKRLDKHIQTSRFAPTVAEIMNPGEPAKKKQSYDSDTLSPAAIMDGYRWYSQIDTNGRGENGA